MYVPRTHHCVDHLRGRPVLVTTISVSLLLTTSFRVAVQESPLLSVTMMGVPGSWSLSGSWATCWPSRTAPQPLVELAGLPTLDRRLVRVGLQVVVGLGRRVWRFGPGGVVGVVGLKVGELGFLRPCPTSRRNQAETLMAFSSRSLSIPRRIWGSTRKRTAVSMGMAGDTIIERHRRTTSAPTENI